MLFAGYNGPRKRFLKESLSREVNEFHWFVFVCEDRNDLLDDVIDTLNMEERELWIDM